MSLFSSLNKPSLFPNPSTTTPLGGTGFAGPNAPNPATTTTGSPFGGLGVTPASQAVPTGGIFGQNVLEGSTSGAQPAAQTGGILGGLGNSTQQQQQTPRAVTFAPLGTPSIPNPETEAEKQTRISKEASGGQAQGALGQPQNQNNAYFDSILERSRKRAHAETSTEDLPQLQLGLADLRQRIKRLGPGGQDRNIDGKAHYLLAASGVDPGAAVRDLNQLNNTTGRVERPQTQETNETDVEGYLANLQTQTTLSMISDGLARSVRDFDAFLEDNVTMEWDAQRKKIYQHFGIKPKEIVGGRSSVAASAVESQAGFGRSRRSKAATMASSRADKPGESTFGRSGLQKSVIGAAGPVGTGNQPLFADVEKKMEANGVVVAGPYDRFQRDKQSKFSEKVQSLNKVRLQGGVYPICAEFGSVVSSSAEAHSSELVKAFRALAEISGENPDVTSLSDPQAVRERQYAESYIDETVNSSRNQQVKKLIIRGGARAFEKLKFESMETFIAKNPREANLGGIPNVISKVKAFVRLQAARKYLAGDNIDLQMLGEDYVWALVYYLLRTGHIQEAVEYVASNAVAFRAIDRNFASYITDYSSSPDRRLRRDLQDRINSEYNQRLRIAPENSIDPYRMACYKIIGRCDLRTRNIEGIELTVEDFTWLQLVLAREINRVDEIASEVYGLTDAQSTIREVGNRYFAKGNAESIGSSWGAFVFFQVAAGMFEEAVSFLYTYSHVDGVHLAIATDFYGLLRVSDPNAGGEDLSSLTTRGQRQISFGRMLGYYTRDFRAANVSAAVDYLALICLNKDLPGQGGRNQITLCHDALRELVLESREFALLLGDIRNDGQRIKGIVEDRMRLIGLDEANDFMKTITIQAASIADDNGRTTDAVLLYHLAEEYDTVMVIVTRALGEAISTPIGQDQLRLQPLKPRSDADLQKNKGQSLSLTSIDDPVALANGMSSLYHDKNMYTAKIKDVNKTACKALLQMSKAKNLVVEGRWAEALDKIITLDILPLSANGNASSIRSYATKFSALPQAVANCVPSLLMWTITCCNNTRIHLASGQYGGNEGTRRMMIDDMKQKNMDLTTFTSQLRYRFPTGLHEALARAQSE